MFLKSKVISCLQVLNGSCKHSLTGFCERFRAISRAAVGFYESVLRKPQVICISIQFRNKTLSSSSWC